MATALFIKRGDIVRSTILDGNVDTDDFIHYVKVAQEIHVKNYLGSKLYDKISTDIIASSLSGAYLTLVNTYIQDMLINYAMVEYLPFAGYKIKNGGIFKRTAENVEIPSKNEIDYLVTKYQDRAEYYTRRMIDYVTYNISSFPEYNTNNNEDVYPDKDSLFHGWVL
jgi:hypothetical protein